MCIYLHRGYVSERMHSNKLYPLVPTTKLCYKYLKLLYLFKNSILKCNKSDHSSQHVITSNMFFSKKQIKESIICVLCPC